LDINAGELFFRNLKYDEFDVSEMDLSETLLAPKNTVTACRFSRGHQGVRTSASELASSAPSLWPISYAEDDSAVAADWRA
jgi:hypothetical protein